jgi:hypothetical protein
MEQRKQVGGENERAKKGFGWTNCTDYVERACLHLVFLISIFIFAAAKHKASTLFLRSVN